MLQRCPRETERGETRMWQAGKVLYQIVCTRAAAAASRREEGAEGAHRARAGQLNRTVGQQLHPHRTLNV